MYNLKECRISAHCKTVLKFVVDLDEGDKMWFNNK